MSSTTENRIVRTNININNIRTAENLSTSRVLHLVYNPIATPSFIDTNFRDINFISYKNNITFASTENRPTTVTATQHIPIRIFSFINITTAGEYVFKSTNQNIKVHLNNFIILDSTRNETFYPSDNHAQCNEWSRWNPTECSVNPFYMQRNCLRTCSSVLNQRSSLPVFLPIGVYNLYIEVIVNQTNDMSLNLDYDILPAVQSTPRVALALKSINTLIGIPYTLIKNAITSRDTGIKSFCSVETNLTNLTPGTPCHTNLRANSNVLQETAFKYCYPDGKTPKMDAFCTHLYSAADIYELTRNDILEGLLVYINTNLPLVSAINQDLINKSINSLKQPETTKILKGLIDNRINDTITTFCETYFTDDKFNPDGTTGTHLCSNLYIDFKDNTLINKSLDNMKYKYCTKIDSTTKKPRYESDPLCTTSAISNGLLFNDISKRCTVNNVWQMNDPFCNTLVDNNINRTDNLKSLVDSKNRYLQNQIRDIKPNDKLPATIDTNLVNYATTVYNKFNNKKLSDDLLRQNLLDYCEINDPKLSNSPCKPLYTTYGTETQIVSSKNKMKDTNCQLSDNLLTTNTDAVAIAENRNDCRNLVFNTKGDINTINKFNNTVNKYCSDSNNIVNEPCKTYYTDIEKKLLDSQFPNLTVSSFTDAPEKRIDIESFENKTSDESSNTFTFVLFFIFFIILLLISKKYYKKFILSKKNNIIATKTN